MRIPFLMCCLTLLTCSIANAQDSGQNQPSPLQASTLTSIAERSNVIAIVRLDGDEAQADNQQASSEEAKLQIVDILRGREKLLNKDKELPEQPFAGLVTPKNDWRERLILIGLEYPKQGRPRVIFVGPVHSDDLGKLQKALQKKQ